MKIAAPKDRTYLEQLNFKKLQKGKKPDGENPKLFYKQLQDEAKSGPVFDTKVLETVEGLPELPKPVTKWIGNLAVKDKLDDIQPQELGLIIDWVRQSEDGGTTINSMTWDEAVTAQQVWHEDEFEVAGSGEYLENKVVFKFGSYTVVEIDNEQDLDTEGNLMGHCVGGDDYWEKVQSGDTKIYSLRDANNRPHVTMEVTEGVMRQCFGKQNATPVAKYHTALIEFFNKFKYFEGYVLIKVEIPENKVEYVIQHGDVYVRMGIAKSTKNSKTLDILSWEEDDRIREYVARNVHTSTETLTALSKDRDSYTRTGVANNPKAPIDALRTLAWDSTSIVQQCVAENANTPSDILIMLAQSRDASVCACVAENPHTPIDVLGKLVQHDNIRVRMGVAKNKRTPLDLLKRLDDDDYKVRSLVHKHPTYLAHELGE